MNVLFIAGGFTPPGGIEFLHSRPVANVSNSRA